MRGNQMSLLVAFSGVQSFHLRVERPIEVRSQFRTDQIRPGDDRLYCARKELAILDDVVELLNWVIRRIVFLHIAGEVSMGAMREGGVELLGRKGVMVFLKGSCAQREQD